MKTIVTLICLFATTHVWGQTIQETWNQCFYWIDCFHLTQHDAPCWVETKTSKDGQLLLKIDDSPIWFIAQSINSKTARAKIADKEVEFIVSDKIHKSLEATIINKTSSLVLVPSDCYKEYWQKQREESEKAASEEYFIIEDKPIIEEFATSLPQPAIYRLAGGFPPYQIEAQTKRKDGKYTRTIKVEQQGELFKITQFIDGRTFVNLIIHVKDGLFGEYNESTRRVENFETSYYRFDEQGCLYDVTVDPMGRGMWFRYCPER